MIITALALMLAVQQNQPPPLPSGDPNPGPRNDRLEDLDQRVPPARSTPEALQTIQRFGACIADASTAKAKVTLAGDFRTPAYRRAIDQLRRYARANNLRLAELARQTVQGELDPKALTEAQPG